MKKKLSLVLVLFLSVSSCQMPLEESQPSEIVCPDAEFGKPMKRHCQSLEERGTPPAFARLNQVLASNAARAGNPPSAELRWEFAGPSPIENFINNPGVSVAGRMISIAIDPKDDNHWFAGSAAGGIFETSNAGQSWNPVNNNGDLPLLGIGAIAIHPQSPSLIYAGTGEPYTSSDGYGGLGIFRSEDGGKTWTLFSDVPFSGQAVADIVLNPSDPNLVVLGATRSRLPAARNVNGSVGIFRSNDRGKTWTSVLARRNISDLEVNAKNVAQIYAGSPGDVSTLWRTFNNGQSWQQVDGPWKNIGRSIKVMLASSPANPNVLYVSIGDSSLNGLWKSVNAWSDQPSFTQINTEATGPFGYCDKQCWYSHTLAVSANDENVLYAGGISLWRYVSGDSKPWTDLGLSQKKGPLHADQHFILPLVEKDGSNVVDGLLVANDGGIFRWNQNRSAKWNSLQNGLTVTQFWSGAISLDGNKIVGGSQDNGSSIDIDEPTLDTDWTSAVGGDGFDALIGGRIDEDGDFIDNDRWILTTQYGTVHRSLDGGASFKRFAQSAPGPFVTRVAQCSSNSDVNIVGDIGGVIKTDDFFSTTPPTFIKQSAGLNSSSNTVAVAFSAFDDTCKTYAYSSWNSVFVTLDGGATWLIQKTEGRVSDIQFMPSYIADFPRLYVTISEFGRRHVVRISCSKMGCDVRDDLRFPADIPVNGMDIDEVSDTLFAATDNGVWMLPNASRCPSESCQWTNFGPDQGFPHVVTYGISIATVGRKVAAFTHGRGAFVMDIHSLKSTPPTNKICEFAGDVCDQYTGWRDRSEQCWNVKVNNIQMCEWESGTIVGGTCSLRYDTDDTDDPCNLAADRQDTQCGAGDFANCVLKDIGT